MDAPTDPDDDTDASPYSPPEAEPDEASFDAENLQPDQQRQLHMGLGVILGMLLTAATMTILMSLDGTQLGSWLPRGGLAWTATWFLALLIPAAVLYVPLAKRVSVRGSAGIQVGMAVGSVVCPLLWGLAKLLFA